MSDELVTIPRATLTELESKAAAHDQQQAAAAAPPTLAQRFARFRARVAQEDYMRARRGE